MDPVLHTLNAVLRALKKDYGSSNYGQGQKFLLTV